MTFRIRFSQIALFQSKKLPGLKKLPSLLGIATLAAFGLAAVHPAAAQDTTYSTLPAFLSNVQPGYYLETFDSLPAFGSVPTPMPFSGNGFAYSADALGGLFNITPDPSVPNDHALSTNFAEDPLIINFTSGNVTAVGGNFFQTEFDGTEIPGDVTVTLDDGTSKTLTGTVNDPQPFVGFTSSVGIQSLTVTEPAGDAYSTINNLIVGSVAPEPSSVADCGVVALIAAGLMLKARKRKASETPV